jgi:hypothetical protein
MLDIGKTYCYNGGCPMTISTTKRVMKMSDLIKIVKNHGISYKVQKERLFVLESYCKNGEHFQDWIECPNNKKDLYLWLGY